jgi:hypothetical protein
MTVPAVVFISICIAVSSLWVTGCGYGDSSTPTPVPTEFPVSPTVASSGSASTATQSLLPTLLLPSLHDGDTLALPADISYEVLGFAGDLPAGVHVQALFDERADGHVIDIPLSGAQGVLTLPDDKLITGKRDIVFQLVDDANAPFENVEARQTFHDLMLTGRR